MVDNAMDIALIGYYIVVFPISILVNGRWPEIQGMAYKRRDVNEK